MPGVRGQRPRSLPADHPKVRKNRMNPISKRATAVLLRLGAFSASRGMVQWSRIASAGHEQDNEAVVAIPEGELLAGDFALWQYKTDSRMDRDSQG